MFCHRADDDFVAFLFDAGKPRHFRKIDNRPWIREPKLHRGKKRLTACEQFCAV
jgi:hypothetical protein